MNFLMKPKESAGCHQTLSARVGSGDETSHWARQGGGGGGGSGEPPSSNYVIGVSSRSLFSLVPRPSPAPVFDRLQYAKTEPEGDLVSSPDPTLSRGETVW